MKINFSIPNIFFNKENIKYILAIVGLYLFFLIIDLPASVVFSNLNLPRNVKVSSVTGTIWSGQARLVRVSGIQLGSINWELHPISLLIGTLSADINITNKKQYIQTQISISSSGKIDLEETRFSINLASLQPLTYGMPVSYSGTASGYFPISYFYKNHHIGLNGKLSLSAIEMTSPQQQIFGDFTVDFRAEKEGATSGQVKDSGGVLNIDGQLSLSKTGQFNLSAKISARDKNSPLAQMIVFFGRKDASGRVQLNNSFKLWH